MAQGSGIGLVPGCGISYINQPKEVRVGKNVKVKIDAVVTNVLIEAVLVGEQKISIVRHLPLIYESMPEHVAADVFGKGWLKLTYPDRFVDMVDLKFKSLQVNIFSGVLSFPEGYDYAALGREYISKVHPAVKDSVMAVTAVVIKEEEPVKASKVVDLKKAPAIATPHELNKKGMCIHCCRQLAKSRAGEFCREAAQAARDARLSPEEQKALERSSDRALHSRLAGGRA
jgi:hypothetical protein